MYNMIYRTHEISLTSLTPPPLVREQIPPMYAASLRLLMNVLPLWETQSCYHDKRRMITTTKTKIRRLNTREEVHSVTAFLNALLPVLHEVAQSEQGVVAHRDPVFRRPGFHSYQDNASIELFLVDLDKSERNKSKNYAPGVERQPRNKECLCVCLKFVSSISCL